MSGFISAATSPFASKALGQNHRLWRKPAVIVDVDGTLVNTSSAIPLLFSSEGEKDFHAFHLASAQCPPHQDVLDWCLDHHAKGHAILVVTARMQEWYGLTQEWLRKHMPCPYDGPFHRCQDDKRASAIIKREIVAYLSQHYQIRAAIDDDPDNIKMFAALGIPTELVPGWQTESQLIAKANREDSDEAR